MGETIKAVLVGCGGISDAWLGPISKRDDIEMVGLVDLNPEAAKVKGEKYSFNAQTGNDLAAMLEKTKPDVVFDCTIPEAHVDVVLTALKYGAHVLGEKPMADTMENARKMTAAAEAAGKIYAVIQNRRYLPQIIAVRDFIKSGKLGKLTTVQSNFFIGAHFGGFRAEMDHVLLLDMAIHTFDAARFLSGTDAEKVYCHEFNPSNSWYRTGASAVAIFEMTNDVVYTYQGSWCAEGCNTTWECDWRFICEKGSLLWDGRDSIRAEVVDDSNEFIKAEISVEVDFKELPEELAGHSGLIADFVEAVKTGTPPQTVCTDNIKSLAMVHAAIGSVEAGRKIDVE
ncbi:MAG: Gfo/Idh/MocA family oxidoreductase [Planctomycetes bacterium]|nr:Gfo/Idh/MocA family oxidoreductase [Planctomycetota bacterium]